MPLASIPDNGVQHGEQLAHAGCEGELLGLTGQQEATIEGSDDSVVAGGTEGRHVELGAHRSPPTLDAPFAVPGAGLTGIGGNADQGSDLLAIEAAELGQFGDQGSGNGIADARHTLQKILRLPPDRRAADGVVEIGFNLTQLLLQAVRWRWMRFLSLRLSSMRARLPSATIISMTWRRRATSSPSRRA